MYIIYEKLQKFTECSLESLHIICFEEKRKRLIYIIHSIMSTAFSFDWPKNVEVFLQIEYWLKNKLVHLVADLFSITNHSIFLSAAFSRFFFSRLTQLLVTNHQYVETEKHLKDCTDIVKLGNVKIQFLGAAYIKSQATFYPKLICKPSFGILSFMVINLDCFSHVL